MTRVDPNHPTEKLDPQKLGLRGQRFFAVIVCEGEISTHPLPSLGQVVLGRGEQVDIRIDHRTVSRQHARLRITPDEISLEDQGSANGTRLADRLLVPYERKTVHVGDVIEVGAAIVMVQPHAGVQDSIPAAPRVGGTSTEPTPATVARVDAETDIIIGNDAMRAIHRLIERVAGSTISVLLLGETGVGKEVWADLLHRLSPRAGKSFVQLNCAAFSGNLLESELFGHEKGAFTGAVQQKPGLLESADGGTVLLDEVGDMPLETQVKLLRVLEERRVTRVGSVKPIPIDIRIIAATHRDLPTLVRSGDFRQDFYYRINGISVKIPPLRERPEEILPLAERFIGQFWQASLGTPHPKLSDAAVEKLQAHGWPGNIRELRNLMERAVVLCDSGVIEPEHLPLEADMGMPLPSASAGARAAPAPSDAVDLPEPPANASDEEQRTYLQNVLQSCAGNQTLAAKKLGISRSTLIRRLKRYGIPRPQKL